MKDLYDELGVSREATCEGIKNAFRARAKQTHPDYGHSDDTAFKAAAHAYEVLSDPEKRRAYDETGHDDTASEVETTLLSLLQMVIEGKYNQSIGDPLDVMREVLKAKQRIVEKELRSNQRTLLEVEAESKRWIRKRKTGRDLIGQFWFRRIAVARMEVEQAEKHLALLDAVSDELEGYSYESEQAARQLFDLLEGLREQKASASRRRRKAA